MKFIERLIHGLFPKPKLKAGRPRAYVCEGGPYDSQPIVLRTGSTLEFTVGGFTGHYEELDSHTLIWVEKA